MGFGIARHDRQQLPFGDGVGLREHEQCGHVYRGDLLDERLFDVAGIAWLGGENDCVGVAERTGELARHRCVELVAAFPEEARRIDEGGLEIAAVQDAEQPVTGRVGFRAHDGQFLPEQRVQQRGLADVRPAHDGHEPAAKVGSAVLHVSRILAPGSR